MLHICSHVICHTLIKFAFEENREEFVYFLIFSFEFFKNTEMHSFRDFWFRPFFGRVDANISGNCIFGIGSTLLSVLERVNPEFQNLCWSIVVETPAFQENAPDLLKFDLADTLHEILNSPELKNVRFWQLYVLTDKGPSRRKLRLNSSGEPIVELIPSLDRVIRT